jgi:DHA2 family multidrug resistance protein
MISLTHLNPDTGADQLFWPLIWRGFASVLMFFPLSLAALGPIPKKDVASASGFFSLTRQLGGSIGIAGITTLVAKQQFVHRSQLVYDVSNLNPAFQPRLDANTSYFQTLSGDVSRVHQQALALLDQSINLQASLLSYRDVFYFVAAIFALSLPLILLLGKRPALAPAKP